MELNKFAPTKKNLNIYRGNATNQVLELKLNGNYTRDGIREYTQQLSNELEAKGFSGEMEVALKYEENWRAGYFSKVGEPIRLYEYHDSDNDITGEPEHFDEFRIYILRRPTAGGCDNKNNDCLYNCLVQALNDDNPFKTALNFKRQLGLQRDDMVDISKMPIIEEKLKNKYQINVEGDHIYTSSVKSLHQINVILQNGHYTLKKNTSVVSKYFNKNEKKPIIWENCTGNVKVYDGTHFEMDYKDFKNERQHFVTSPYVFIPKTQKKSMEETLDEFKKQADELKKHSKGVINLYKTGSHYNTALSLFNRFQNTITPDEISQQESQFLMKGTMAAMIWAEKYEGLAYKYDVTSMYPYLLQNPKFLIPVKKGECITLTNKEFQNKKVLSYGIYRAKIENENKKLFKTNVNNYYTHIDINQARVLGLKITMLEDNSPNAVIYSRDKLENANRIFKKFVTFLFDLKKKKVSGSKQILNILWGALSEINNSNYRYNTETNDTVTIPENNEITSIKPVDEKIILINCIKQTKCYKSNWGRIAPFVIAKGREMINNIMKNHIEHIKRVHTDGIISDVKLKIETGNELGELKYEGYCKNVKIVNNIKIIGDFVI